METSEAMTNSVTTLTFIDRDVLRNAPSLLKNTILPVSTTTLERLMVLVDIIEAQEENPGGAHENRPYLVLDDKVEARKKVGASRLVRRDCYDHLMPLVINNMEAEDRVTIQGTPGIGKTVFGFFVLRELIQKISTGNESTRKTVVYWDEKSIIVFSKDSHYKKKFGLNVEVVIKGEQWSCGAWEDTRYMNEELLSPDDIYVIHDPKAGFVDAGIHTSARLTLIIVSFGHDLFRTWFTKGEGPEVRLRMPFFRCDEKNANRLD